MHLPTIANASPLSYQAFILERSVSEISSIDGPSPKITVIF
jgi:hypothetical protein